jgi:hypothetical protein
MAPSDSAGRYLEVLYGRPKNTWQLLTMKMALVRNMDTVSFMSSLEKTGANV